ncbi:MAG: hypothetical protein JNK58_10435 [Phycisphaerae bacterium]|nr:hypothetical protein [Phycisphaerae bacterium]
MESASRSGGGANPKCAHCRRTLYQGFDAWRFEPGVMGTRGFVSLDDADDPQLFCSMECLEDELCSDDADRSEGGHE